MIEDKQLITNRDWNHAPYSFVISAITKAGGVTEEMKGDMNITFQINGVNLPFEETLTNVYERMCRQFNNEVQARAEKIALEVISEAGLMKYKEALDRADSILADAIDNAIGVVRQKVQFSQHTK